MTNTLQDNVILITGGASGIGRAAALACAELGAKLVISDVNREGGEDTIAQIADRAGEAIFVPCDVTQEDQVRALIDAAVEAYGRIDGAVNNAGISGGMVGRLHETTLDQFDQVIGINLKGVWLCMKYELPVMQRAERGSIVNVASVAGLLGTPKGSIYSASKHGVIGLTRSAAVEYAKAGLRINAVCPAYTDTPMVREVIERDPAMADLTVRGIPMRRLGRSEEIAAGIVWLLSESSSFVTGHALTMDGGLSVM
jgi:NAD(P)-dependent dehydrogenase (short-subunit alcohol dehydrogenase family)